MIPLWSWNLHELSVFGTQGTHDLPIDAEDMHVAERGSILGRSGANGRGPTEQTDFDLLWRFFQIFGFHAPTIPSCKNLSMAEIA